MEAQKCTAPHIPTAPALLSSLHHSSNTSCTVTKHHHHPVTHRIAIQYNNITSSHQGHIQYFIPQTVRNISFTQRCEQETSIMAASIDLDFFTQEQRAWSEDPISTGIISETPAKYSVQDHTIWSDGVQEIILTAAPPSHQSDEPVEQAENHDLSQLNHDSSLPQAKSLDSRSSPASHPLENDCMHKLYLALYEVLVWGHPLVVLHQAVDQAAATYRHYLNPTRPREVTRGHIVMTMGQDHNLEEHATALASDDAGGSQPGENSGSPTKGTFFLTITLWRVQISGTFCILMECSQWRGPC